MDRVFVSSLVTVLAVAATGCANVVANRITEADRNASPFQALFEVDGGAELLDALTEARIDARADDGVDLHARVIGPAARSFASTALAPDHGPVTAGAADGPMVRMVATFRYFGTTTRRDIRFRAVPAKPGAAVRGTVVLLHGFGMDHLQMVTLALELADHGWRSVLVDLRGHGDSGGTRRTWGPQDGRDIAAVLDAVDARGLLSGPVVAVGTSYGAAAALHWAGHDPRATAVVTVGAFSNAAEAIRDGAKSVSPLLARVVGRRAIDTGIDRAGTTLDVDLVGSASLLAAAGGIADRLLIIHGQDDAVVPVVHAERLHAAARGSKLLIHPGVGHLDLLLRQELLAPHIICWFDAVAPASEPQDAGHHFDCVPRDPDPVAVDGTP